MPVLIATFAGIALAISWWLSLRSYRDLNTAKFSVIAKMEAQLPVHLFEDEWSCLKKDPVKGWRGRYAELGQVERVVPAIFALLYVTAIGTLLIWP